MIVDLNNTYIADAKLLNSGKSLNNIMPYKTYKKGSGYKACKVDGKKCFSKKSLPKERAEAQVKALYASEAANESLDTSAVGSNLKFKVKLKDADKDFVFDETEADLNKFDKFIDEIEPGALRLPVLLKKYIKQNAKLVAFNVDPLFNNSVDGLMYIRIADLPESTVKPVMEEFQAELERKFMENNNENS